MIKQQQLKFTRRFISASSMLTITSVDRCATDLIISKHTLLVLAAIWNYTKLKTLPFQANTEKIYPSRKLTPRSLISECMMIKNWVLLYWQQFVNINYLIQIQSRSFTSSSFPAKHNWAGKKWAGELNKASQTTVIHTGTENRNIISFLKYKLLDVPHKIF